MASYTMELREYIEQVTQNDVSLSTRERIEKGRTKLFDFDYPIFDPNYKAVFETHFIRNFYMTEIGFETEGLFKFQLETWLLINMPYFNKLFESELIKFDPLVNSHMEASHTNKKGKDQSVDNTTDVKNNGTTNNTTSETSNNTTSGTSNNTTSGTQTDDNFNRQLDSKTPDGRLNLTANDGEGVIEYANEIVENNENNQSTSSGTSDTATTGTTETTASGTSEGTSSNTSNIIGSTNATITETEDYVQTRTGKVGVQTYSKMLTEYRQSLLRLENTIFDEMRKKLFMLVY